MSKLLIVGSVHLDIVGNFEKSVKDHIDKEGSLRFSVGGAAFNIAANLAYKGYVVSLFTYLKKESLSADIIKSALQGANINTKYITEDLDLSESGYVSHSLSGELVSAVSSMAIQEKAFDDYEKKRLDSAVKSHALVVLDTNLSVGQIETVIDIAEAYGKPLFVCNVSDSKCHRLIDIRYSGTKKPFRFILINEKELSTVFNETDQLTSESVCDKFRAETVLVTYGKKGYNVYSRIEGENYNGSSVPVAAIKSELGAGDALFAAVVSYYISNNRFIWQDCEQIINEYVGRVLKSEGATPEGLNITFTKRKTEEKTQSLIALSSAGLAAILTGIGFFLVRSVNWYAILFIVIPFLSGIGGAFVRHLLGKGGNMTKNILANVSLGGVAGVLVAVTFFLSHWSTLGNAISDMLSNSVIPANMRPILGFLFISAFAAGLAVEVAFEKTTVKNIDDKDKG